MKIDFDPIRLESAYKTLLDACNPEKKNKPTLHFVPVEPKALQDLPSTPLHHLGCILLAGGQATRMNMPEDMPKALLTVTPIQKKCLLELFLEKIASYQYIFKTQIEVALFVSESTYGPIRSFIDTKGTFGISKEQITYIKQPSLPFFDSHGNILLDENQLPLCGPDGNGSLFFTMGQHNLFKIWKEKGVEYVTVGPIDNPLLDPFYPLLLSHVLQYNIVFTAIKKKYEAEKVGVFAKSTNSSKLKVVEYSELSESKIEAPYTISDFQWANISQFAFQLKWAEDISIKPLPWHVAHKNSHGRTYYKMEQFFFDALQYATTSVIVPIDRDRYFAPIKQQKGDASQEAAIVAMLEKDKKIFESLFSSKKSIGKARYPLELHPFWDYYICSSHQEEYENFLLSSGYMKAPF